MSGEWRGSAGERWAFCRCDACHEPIGSRGSVVVGSGWRLDVLLEALCPDCVLLGARDGDNARS